MDVTSKEAHVAIESAAQVSGHTHDWRVVEVDFSDGAALRVFECACGAADVDSAA